MMPSTAHMIETLKHGRHSSPEDGMCLLEAASYLAGEPFSDHPQCVSPLLGMFGRAINDRMPDDATRALLLPLLPRLLSTAGDGKDERRGFMCADWIIRSVAPRVLDAAGLTEQSATLRGLSAVVDEQTALAARDAAYAAAAYAVARAARAADADAYADAYAYAYAADAAYAAYAAADVAEAATCAAAALSWPEVVEFFGRLIAADAS